MNIKSDIFKQLIVQNLKERYLNAVLGPVWALLQPGLLLATYAFVFTYIFSSRLPEAYEVSFVAYMAIAFWPWNAFAESLQAGTTAIVENKALLEKVAISPVVIVVSKVTATFIFNMIGYALILVVLAIAGVKLHWIMLPVIIIPLLALFILSNILAIILSSMQVFIRDITHLLQFIITSLFFLSPILYPPEMIPEEYRSYLELNPLIYYFTTIRDILINGEWMLGWLDLKQIIITLVALIVSYVVYKRCRPSFEDYL